MYSLEYPSVWPMYKVNGLSKQEKRKQSLMRYEYLFSLIISQYWMLISDKATVTNCVWHTCSFSLGSSPEVAKTVLTVTIFYTGSFSWPVSRQLIVCGLEFPPLFQGNNFNKEQVFFNLYINNYLWSLQDFAGSRDLYPHWRVCLFFSLSEVVLARASCAVLLKPLSFSLFCKLCKKNTLWTH